MDQGLKIFTLLNLCIMAQAKEDSLIIHTLYTSVMVPDYQLGTTEIVSSPVQMTQKYPLLVTITAKKKASLCDTPTETGSESTNASCPDPHLTLSITAITNYGITHVYDIHIIGGLWLTINVGIGLSFNTMSLGAQKDTAKLYINYNYESKSTNIQGLKKDSNATVISVSLQTATVQTTPSETQNRMVLSGEPALHFNKFTTIKIHSD
ncbi:uncharacterized protein LOC143938738 isoform X2 [Lithobates pipiens]